MSDPAKERAGGGRKRAPRSEVLPNQPTGRKKKASPQEPTGEPGIKGLMNIFPDWDRMDLELLLEETAGDVNEASRRIFEGLAEKSHVVQSKSRKEPVKAKKPDVARKTESPKTELKSEQRKTPDQKKGGLEQKKTAAPKSAKNSAPMSTAAAPSNVAAAAVAAAALTPNGKMSWAQALKEPISKKLEAEKAAAVQQQQKADKKKPNPMIPTALRTSSESTGNGPALPPASVLNGCILETASVQLAQAETSAAPAVAEERPTRPDGKMSWAQALGPRDPPKEEKQEAPKEIKETKETKETKKKETKETKDSAPKEKEEKKRKRKNKKNTALLEDAVTDQLAKLDLPSGPAAEQQQTLVQPAQPAQPAQPIQQQPQAQQVSPAQSQQDASQAAIPQAPQSQMPQTHQGAPPQQPQAQQPGAPGAPSHVPGQQQPYGAGYDISGYYNGYGMPGMGGIPAMNPMFMNPYMQSQQYAQYQMMPGMGAPGFPAQGSASHASQSSQNSQHTPQQVSQQLHQQYMPNQGMSGQMGPQYPGADFMYGQQFNPGPAYGMPRNYDYNSFDASQQGNYYGQYMPQADPQANQKYPYGQFGYGEQEKYAPYYDQQQQHWNK